MEYKNLADMFFKKREMFGDKTGYMYKQDGEWVSVSFKEAVDRAERVAGGLASLGVKKGDKVAIMSENRLEWALSDYAILSLGAITVPIYPSLLPDQVRYILEDSEAVAVIASHEVHQKKIESVRKHLNFAKNFFVMDPEGVELGENWKTYNDLEELGGKFLKDNSNYVTDSIDKIGLEDWATIIYTSGTTGEPKGAVLTHKNFISNLTGVLQVVDIRPDDSMLSFLPLSHVFERMAGHFLSCYQGTTVAYAESIDTVADNLKEVKPTLMISVPRLYEKIYAKIIDQVESGPPLKRKIFYWAINVGKKYVYKEMMKESIPGGLQFKRNLAYKLVYHKLHEALGGRNRFMVSGGAPLAPEIAEFFGAVGIRILEGYGLTETSPVISVNQLENFRFGTVGPILPNVEVKFAEDGEILTRGDHVMVGYFKKEAETKEAIDEDGWFHTGDIGIMEDGFLKITDRKKNIIVTAGGKNIAPAPIENALVTSQFIEQAVMIGDKRKFCTAVIVAAEDPVSRWAKEKGLSFSNYEELVALPEVRELIKNEIDRLTPHLASYETIKNFVLARAPFSIETGELTPSLKVKRRIIEQKYHDDIEKMYEV
ncbi:MAG TPA: long-chain fatty acid--CoA ligase [Caldithrix abyssi]|uniref:Long-chain fatty acid--CoA ligase n=1 Tax=Caldithrix abyssi TaxID=187145 RepID=A0A7V4UD42_CALAY|nr:long-chain fatty acid--CoA ligase [Caldithrix abyssi]